MEGALGRLWKASFPKAEFLATETDLHLDLPYDDNEFDNILCCEVFEHIGDINFRSSQSNFCGVLHFLSEMTRVLKTGGKVVLTTPNVTSINNIRLIMRGTHPFMYPLHYREYTRYELERMLSCIGIKNYFLESENVFMRDEKIIRDITSYLALHNLTINDRGDDWFLVYEKPSDWVLKNFSNEKSALMIYPSLQREPVPDFKAQV